METDLPDVRVEDGRAHGLVGGVDEPNVELRAGGRIVLTRGGN